MLSSLLWHEEKGNTHASISDIFQCIEWPVFDFWVGMFLRRRNGGSASTLLHKVVRQFQYEENDICKWVGLYYALSGKFLTCVSRGNEKVMLINASRSEINMGSSSTLLQQVLWQFNGCCSILLCDAKKKNCGTVPELVLQISVQTKGCLRCVLVK